MARTLTAPAIADLPAAPELHAVADEVAPRSTSRREARSGDVELWRARQRKGKPPKDARRLVARIQPHGTGHPTLLEVTSGLARLGSEGKPGIARLERKGRAVYVEHYPESAKAWDDALAGSIATFGPPPVTFELSKAEKKARKARQTPQEPAGATGRADLYVDVAAFRSGSYEAPVTNAGGTLPDLACMLYLGKVHSIVGESGIGKTFAAFGMICDELKRGGRVLLLDADFNGLDALHRLESMLRGYGIDPAILEDRARFRLTMPEDRDAYLAVQAEAPDWSPTLVVLDSEAQIVPMFGGDSNSADDYARVNREAFAPFATAGAAVLTIDHVAKTARDSGYASGSGAKRAVRDGVIYIAKSVEPFRPDVGGALALEVSKDRFGGALRVMPGGGAIFRLDSRGDAWTYDFHLLPSDDQRGDGDLAALLALDPAPTSRRDVMDRLGWGTTRAGKVLAAYRARIASTVATFPLDPTTLPSTTN